MRRPEVTTRSTSDKAIAAETGHTRAEWFAHIEGSRAEGRSAVGKFLLGKKVDSWWITVIMIDYEDHACVVEKDGRPKGYSLCITKSVAAPVKSHHEAVG